MRLKCWDYNLQNKVTRRNFVRTKECVHCGKFLLNTKYQFHLLIHSYEKPVQCYSCHLRFSNISYLEAHLKLFHKNKNSGYDDSLILHTDKPKRKSHDNKVVSPEKNSSKNPTVNKINSLYTKEHIFSTTAEDRAKRYEARKAKLELGAGNLGSRTTARRKTIPPSKIPSSTKCDRITATASLLSPNLITGTKIVAGFAEGEAYTSANGIIRCNVCSEVFYGLAPFKWHWSSEHKRSAEVAKKSLAMVNEHNQNMQQELKRDSSLLEQNHRKIISSQWSRKLISKYKKLNAKKSNVPVQVKSVKSTLKIPEQSKTEKGYRCPYCDHKTFEIVYDFKLHLANHEGRKTHGCFFCPLQFLSQDHLETHLKALHRLTVA